MEFEQFTVFNLLISQGCNSGNFGDNDNIYVLKFNLFRCLSRSITRHKLFTHSLDTNS